MADKWCNAEIVILQRHFDLTDASIAAVLREHGYARGPGGVKKMRQQLGMNRYAAPSRPAPERVPGADEARARDEAFVAAVVREGRRLGLIKGGGVMEPPLSLWRTFPPRPPTMRALAQEVAERHGLTLAAMRGAGPRRSVAWPRQEAMALMHATGAYSMPQIGRFFGRDHTTVLWAIRRVKERGAGAVQPVQEGHGASRLAG